MYSQKKLLLGVFQRFLTQQEQCVSKCSCQHEIISPRLLTMELEKATWAIRNPQFPINGKTAG